MRYGPRLTLNAQVHGAGKVFCPDDTGVILPDVGKIMVVQEPILRDTLRDHLLDDELVKAVVDCRREIMAIGGELHADGEQVLLEQGWARRDLWGINVYPDDHTEDWIEFDSMINLRPSQGNRSRGVEDVAVRERIRNIVMSLVRDA